MKLPFVQTNAAPVEENTAVPPPEKKNLLRRLGAKRIVAVAVALAVVGTLAFRFLGQRGAPSALAGLSYTTAAVERRDITSSITGSGTLQAADSYSVTSLVEGTILSADFQEGDQIDEGAVLYTIDSSNAASSLEQSQISLNQAQRKYNDQLEKQADLNVTASTDGQVLALNVEVGDKVSSGQAIATIRDAATMRLELTFPADEAAQFYVGQSASVTLDSTFEVLPATISKISGATTVLSGNILVRTVTIDVSNPGGLSTLQSASAAVGTVTSTTSGTFTYRSEKTVTADVSGEVASVRVSEGDTVSEGQTLVLLVSKDLEESLQSAAESLRNAEISLENRYNQLDDYTITSPINGTIIDKNYNAGETSESNQVLCTIYDLSYLTMTLSVDELDISDIAVGQTVAITAPAVENKVFQGVVTKVSVAGSASSGVTTYPVTIRIDETDGLLPGMNVDATIVLGSASNVLTIPAAALQRGNTVLVTADSPSAANGTEMPQPGGGQEGAAQGGDQAYYAVPVTVGVGDDNYLEVVSGLQEGDTVAYIPTSASGNFSMSFNVGGMGSMTTTMPGGAIYREGGTMPGNAIRGGG